MNRSLGLIALFTVCTLLVSGCQRQTSMVEKLTKPFQETIEQQRRQFKIPGASAAVILPDGTTWLGVSGKSSDGQAMNSSKLFGLGSVSKTYIAALVVQLVEEGAVSVDDVVRDWIPELDQVSGDIAVHQLLNHTTGLYRYQLAPEYSAAIYAQPDRVWAAPEIIEEFQGEPECQPGTCWGESALKPKSGEQPVGLITKGQPNEKQS